MELNFSINDIVLEKIANSRFLNATIYAFADGANAHTLPIDFSVLKNAAPTIYDIPILCKYSRFHDDFLAHEEDEYPIGFIKEDNGEYKNPIRFETVEDGRVFTVIKGVIWSKYSEDAIKVLKKKDKKKSVSVEIEVVESEEINGKLKVLNFIFQGITVLGDFIQPACEGAHLKMEFSKAKEDFLNNQAPAIIDNVNFSKKRWYNPYRQLYTKTLQFSNKDELLSEIFFKKEDVSSVDGYRYPHHIYEGKELQLSVNGLIQSFSKIIENDDLNLDNLNHIMRHFKDIGINDTNYINFGIDSSLYKIFKNKKEEILKVKVGEEDMSEEKFDKDIDNIYGMEKSEGEKMEDTKEPEIEKDNPEEVMSEEVIEDEGKEEVEEIIEKDVDEKEEPESELTVEDMKSKIRVLEEENRAYMSKLEEMSDYEELKKFKADTLEEKRHQEELMAIEKIMSDIEDKGCEMSKEDKEELIKTFSEFSSISAWENFVKAKVFDSMNFNNAKQKEIEKFSVSIDLNREINDKQEDKDSVWAEF